MTSITYVRAPGAGSFKLSELETMTIWLCDGCGHEDHPDKFIPTTIRFGVPEAAGEGATVNAHLCGRWGCALSEFAYRFEALWSLVGNQPAGEGTTDGPEPAQIEGSTTQ